jgi:tripeptide aminopeptidase
VRATSSGAASVGVGERARLHETFSALCRVRSHSRAEHDCAALVARELRGLGIEVEEDAAASSTAGDSGNLIARIPPANGAGPEDEPGWIALCAHLDTVPVGERIDPVVVDGRWQDAGGGVLGADDKAGVAVLVELARRAAQRPPPVGLELVFTVAEEVGMLGAHALGRDALRARTGFVLDQDGPLEQVVLAAPTYFLVEAELRGRAAHAGIRPQEGRSAVVAAATAISRMRLGRIDDRTTANVGWIEGGSSASIVADRCQLAAEVRSVDEDAADALLAELVDHLQDAANETDCDVDVAVRRLFAGYRVRPGAPSVTIAEAALRGCGREPRRIVAGAGSDANALRPLGLDVVSIGSGAERTHEPGEGIAVESLEGLLDVAVALVEEAPGRC